MVGKSCILLCQTLFPTPSLNLLIYVMYSLDVVDIYFYVHLVLRLPFCVLPRNLT